MKLFAVAFIVTLALIVWAADQRALPDFVVRLYHFRYGDKVGHFILMGMFNFSAIILFLKRGSYSVKRIITISAAVFAIVAAEEFSQRYFAARTYSLIDLLASFGGILCFGLLAAYVAKRGAAPEVVAEER